MENENEETTLGNWCVTGTLSPALTLMPNKPQSVMFYGPDNQPVVTISFDPPHVEVAQGVEWNAAAKLFWNEVARMAGQDPPFGW
jgi:hypothetical protein